MNNLRWYFALVDDDCLQIIPGSQLRNRTERERECLVNSPHDDCLDKK